MKKTRHTTPPILVNYLLASNSFSSFARLRGIFRGGFHKGQKAAQKRGALIYLQTSTDKKPITPMVLAIRVIGWGIAGVVISCCGTLPERRRRLPAFQSALSFLRHRHRPALYKSRGSYHSPILLLLCPSPLSLWPGCQNR